MIKRFLLFLSFLLLSIGIWSAEVVYKETIFNSTNNSASIQNYTSTWYNTTNGFRVDITNANNNQNGWNYIKFGRKGNASTGTIITNAAIDKKVTKVGITIDALTSSKITSITLYTSTNGSTWTSRGTFSKATGTQYDEIYSSNLAENLYYKITFVCLSGSSNGLITISHVYFYVEEEVLPCDSVTVSLTPPTNGTASLSKSKVCPNDDVEVTYTPDDGYLLDKILANDVEVTSPVTITENTTIQVLFKEIPPAPSIDVVEWNPDWLKIDIENFTAVTAVLEDQNTLADIKLKFAKDLFFSKYFEGGGTNKMLGFYNGTKDTLDLSKYTFKTARVSAAAINLGNYGNYNGNYMLPNTEILFVHYDEVSSAKTCADDIEGYQDWIEVPSSGTLYSQMNFGGRTSIALYKNDTLIDILGIHHDGEPYAIYKPCASAKITGLNDDVGFYTYSGDNIKTKDVIENDYFLSTNRCMLVRKNTVKDGSNAVLKNNYSGADNICNDTIALQFKTLSTEWMGYLIGNGKNDDALADSTCVGLAYAGHYDYTDYYVAYDTIYTEKPIPGLQEDGYYKIDIPQLDTLSCTNLKIVVKDASSNELEQIIKIPIMIKTNTYTDDATYFNKKECDKCDVVVLKDKILTARSTKANRDVKLYEGSELRIPTSSNYTINSLAFRRYNDSVSSLFLDGGILNITDKVYLDLLVTPDDWHYITVPGNYAISNIRYVNGTKPVHGTDYLVKYYNGKYRAEYQRNGWKTVPSDSIIEAGQGFILGLYDDLKKKEFRLEFDNTIISAETSDKTINGLHAWGITNSELRPNHKGWNLIGNPFLGYFEAEIYDKIRVDSLVKVIENGKWTGLWELSNTSRGKSLRYAVIPSKAPEDKDAGGYKSVVLDDMKLLPFTCFFVLLGGNSESALGVQLHSSRRSAKSMIRRIYEEEDEELFLRVKVDNWKTGCFISNDFNEGFEPGDDLESRYPIYLNIGGYKLLYSAINDSIIESGILVNTPTGHLILDPKVNRNAFEYVYVLYNDEWYNLLYEEVDVENQFTLYAKRKEITTDIDEYKATKGIYKFTDGKHVYINVNDKIYNIIGDLCR